MILKLNNNNEAVIGKRFPPPWCDTVKKKIIITKYSNVHHNMQWRSSTIFKSPEKYNN